MAEHKQIAVLGLGRFGMSIVRTLSEYDVNVLACDRTESRLSDATDYATHVVQADVSDEGTLRKLGIGNFDVVILGMGEDFESAVLATAAAKEAGAKYIVAKARGPRQKKILESVGADHVVLPESEMGMKIARKLLNPKLLDILDDSDYYTISEMEPMAEWVGKSVRQADVRRKHNLTILAIRNGTRFILPVPPDRTFLEDDVLITLSERPGNKPAK